MGRKRRETSKAELDVPAGVYARLRDLEAESRSNALLQSLHRLLVAPDSFEKVSAVKQIKQEMMDCKGSVGRDFAVEVLVEVQIAAAAGHPVKRAAFRLLEECSTDLAVASAMSRALEESLRRQGSDYTLHNIENILFHLSEPLGTEAVENCFSRVLGYLEFVLRTGVDSISSSCDTQVIGDCYQLLAKVAKAVGLVIQLRHGQRKNFDSPDLDKSLSAWADDVLPLLLHLLKSDSSILTCKLSTGTVLPLVLKVKNAGHFRKAFDPWPAEWFSHSPLAEVCFLSGLIGSLTTEELLSEDIDDVAVPLKLLLDKAVSIHERSREPAFLLTCVKTVLQLVNRILQVLKSDVHSKKMLSLLSPNSTVSDSLLHFVWSYWEHYIDAVSQHARLVFKAVVDMNLLVFEGTSKAKPFLEDLATFLIDLSWHRKGKYDAIGYLAEVMGCEVMLKLRPGLVDGLLSAAEEPAMCSYVKDLVQKLAAHHAKEVSPVEFEHTWLDPLLSLTQGSRSLRKLLVPLFQHVLPVLVTIYPGTTQFVFGKLPEHGNDLVPATLKCLLLDKPLIESGNLQSWEHMLEQGMCHRDTQVRLDVLRLLVEHPKSCEPPTAFCLEKVRQFLGINMAVQWPSFRQQMLASLKKLLHRIYDSNTLLSRQQRRQDPSKQPQQGYQFTKCPSHQEFISWLLGCCLKQLFPGANFCRRSTALEIIRLLTSTHSSKGSAAGMFLPWTSEGMTTLLQCLKDPYEANKSAVFEVLLLIPPELQVFRDKASLEDFFAAVLALTRSARPPDSVTASYHLDFLSNLDVAEHVALKLWRTRQPPLGLQVLKDEKNGVTGNGTFWTIALLLSELDCQLEVARRNLLEASSAGPLYGAMVSLRRLLRKVPWRKLDPREIETWKPLLDCSLTLAFEVAAVVGPIVTNASPEGQLDLDGDPDALGQMQAALQMGLGRKFEMVNEQRAKCEDGQLTRIDVVKSTAVAAQMLLLCGWRAHREVSLLFGEVCELCPLADEPARGPCLLPVDQVLKIGNFFMDQMSSVRHRGAFEQAYTAFQKLCHVLWRCKNPVLMKLPAAWTGDLASAVKEKGISSTRRSAGIPYIVQALLVSEPEVFGSAAFHQAMKEFLLLANADEDSAIEIKVHAMNVLRALFREARLGDAVMPYVADGVKAAVTGFESDVWAVRNAATLLFSTLMTRIFGVNRGRDEEPQRRNCLTAHVFFLRFPPLFHFLLEQLEAHSTCSRDRVLASSSFPVLLLLSRLFPSVVEGGFRLDDFVPYVVRCASSPVWKVRELAARALVPLVAPTEKKAFLLQRLEALPSPDGTQERLNDHNATHGTLLQVLQIVKQTRESFEDEEFVNSVWRKLEQRSWLASERNSCLVTRAAFYSVVLACLQSLPNEKPPSEVLTKKLVEAALPGAISFTQWKRLAVGGEFFLATSHELLLELGAWYPELLTANGGELNYASFLVGVLSSASREARWAALRFLRSTPASRVSRACLHGESSRMERGVLEALHNASLENILSGPGKAQENAIVFSEACAVLSASRCHSFAHLNWKGLPTLASVLEYLLGQMELLTQEQTKRSLLELCCHVAEQLINSEEEGRIAPKDMSEKRAALRHWMVELEFSSEPNQDLARRVTASKALGALVAIVVGGEERCGAVSFWRALVNFLRDDEACVRDSATTAVYSLAAMLGDPDFPPSLFSRQTPLDAALGLFVRLNSVADSIPCLVNWMLECEVVPLEAESDEQPFEKGELNTYAEEVVLTESCSQLLRHSASLVPPGTVFDRSAFVFLDLEGEQCALTELSVVLSLEDVYKHVVREFHTVAEQVLSSRTVLLLNRHADPPLIRFYQHLSVADVLRDYVSECVVSETATLVEQTLALLKNWGGLTTFLGGAVEKLTSLGPHL